MRIAIPFENGNIYQHFGKTETFKIYDEFDGQIMLTGYVDTNGTGHSALAGFLKSGQVDAVICGAIGDSARKAVTEAGIKLYPGVTGSADEAAEKLAAGTLEAGAENRDSRGKNKK